MAPVGGGPLTMPDRADAITVIIPTLALSERAEFLKRAIESVLSQDVRAVPLVVLNGLRKDRQLVAALERDKRVRVVRLSLADLPGALRAGRSHVDTPLFTALDDDDVLLPFALRLRRNALAERPEYAAVVTNGWRRDARGDVLHVPSFDEVRRDPLRNMLKCNWLLPGAWLGRTHAFQCEVFERMPRYLECTYLGVRLATTHRTCFLDVPTVAWSVNTPGSMSKSREYVFGQEEAIRRILEIDLPADVRRRFRQKLADAQHFAARLHLEEGNRRAAWACHLRSLRQPGSWRLLRLTPRLFMTLRAGVSRP
jgi:hypothetical protein